MELQSCSVKQGTLFLFAFVSDSEKMKWLFVISALFGTVCGADKFTFTYDMAKLCKEHICDHGYSYEVYYRVDSNDRRPIKKDPNVIFEMHIAILAPSNGHILLSPVNRPNATDPVYEIVVGGGANKFSELRRNLRKNAKVSGKTIGILSTIEFRPFYIRVTKDGLIKFVREGEDKPILEYRDVNPLQIKYFSFAAWNGVEAKFLYDCPIPGENSSPTESEAMAPKLSNSDQLMYMLLLNRYPSIQPRPLMNVQLGIKVTSVGYDAFSSKLYTNIAVITSWTDDSMAWNPDKFNGTKSLKLRQGSIWRPTFFVYNSDDKGMLEPRSPDMITMVNSGEAIFHYQTKLATWCYENEGNKGLYWPRDEYVCSIIIQPWEPHEQMQLRILKSDDIKMMIFSDVDEIIQNEWEVSVDQHMATVSNTELADMGDNATREYDRLYLEISLKRRATSYNIVFYTPLIVLLVFILMSFWSEPLQLSRIYFYAGCSIVICFGLCYVDYLVPTHNVPSILILYLVQLIGVLLALLVNAFLRTNIAKKMCNSTLVQAGLNCRIIREIFCLTPIKTCHIYDTINEGYSHEDDDSGVVIAPRYNVEEMESDNKKCEEIQELAEIIDKCMFFVYSIVFAVLFSLHY